MLTGTMVACGTNWAMTPATGVPCPSSVFASRCSRRAAAAAAAATSACAAAAAGGDAVGREVLVAQAAGKDVGTRRDPAAERGDVASTPVSTTSTALFCPS